MAWLASIQADFNAGFAPVVICYAVVGDSPQPGAETGFAAKILQRLNDRHKNILGYIFHILSWNGKTNPLVHGWKVALIQKGERVWAALQGLLPRRVHL